LPYFPVFVTLDVLGILKLDFIVLITINSIEYMVMSTNCVVDERISRRNSKWQYFSVCIDVRIQYGGIISLITTHTQVE